MPARCCRSWRRGRCRASRRWSTACTGGACPTAILELRPARDHVDVTGPLPAAQAILRLDADPEAILARLGGDPLLGPLVRAAPGRRIPGHPDPAELAVRALLGQQVSVAAARTLAGRLVAMAGEPLEAPVGGITHRFPTPEALAALDPDALPMPRARARALVGMAGRGRSASTCRGSGRGRPPTWRCARATTTRSSHRPRRQARPRGARRRPARARCRSPRPGGRTAASRWRTCGRQRRGKRGSGETRGVVLP